MTHCVRGLEDSMDAGFIRGLAQRSLVLMAGIVRTSAVNPASSMDPNSYLRRSHFFMGVYTRCRRYGFAISSGYTLRFLVKLTKGHDHRFMPYYILTPHFPVLATDSQL